VSIVAAFIFGHLPCYGQSSIAVHNPSTGAVDGFYVDPQAFDEFMTMQ